MAKKLYFGLARDHSASMRSLTSAAMRDYNTLIEGIRKKAEQHGFDTVVSVVRCGSGPQSRVERESTISSVNVLKPLTRYDANGNSTPLYDSVGDLITQFKNLPDIDSPDVQVMIMSVTDGGENSSRTWNSGTLSREIQGLQGRDNWSFVFRVPKGYSKSLIRQLGLHEGNIYEWDTTARGMEQSTVVTEAAFDEYFTASAAGQRSTSKFYTNLKDVSVKEVKAALTDISSQVQLWTVQTAAEGNQIRTFCEAKSGKPFLKGAAFYQLTKTEDEVQDYKKLAIRDKNTGAVYSGPNARTMLGFPLTGTIRVAPGDHGQFDIYIQSTSVNRKLPVGTNVLYWNGVGTAFKEGASAPAKAAPAPVAAKPQAAPKANLSPQAAWPYPTGQRHANKDMYLAGYKDGRGKKKNRKDSFTGTNQTDYLEGFADGKAKKNSKF